MKKNCDKKVQQVVSEQIEWTHQIKNEFNSMTEENRNRIRLMEQQYE